MKTCAVQLTTILRRIGEWGVTPRILNLSATGVEWSAARPGYFIAGEEPLVPIG